MISEGEGVRVRVSFQYRFQASYDDRFDYCLDSHHQASLKSKLIYIKRQGKEINNPK